MRIARWRAGTMHAVVLTAGAILLSGCASDAVRTETPVKPDAGKSDTGNWKFERRNNPISGTEVTTAWLLISEYNFLSGRIRSGELQLMCFKNQPVVRLRFNVRVGTERTAALAYRFDGQEGRYAKATFFSRDGLIVIDHKDEVAQFSAQLQTAKTLHLRITRLRGSPVIAEFAVHGASHAIEAAYADCPVSGKPKVRTAARS